VVFALTVALMLSDYMTRSVMNAVLPDLKAAWALDDRDLGALVGIVPLIVGLAAWPVAWLADRWGYVRSIVAMATLWCVATVLCGLSQTPGQMLLARAAVGFGEAGYGAVGAAMLSAVFPPSRLSAVQGTFQSGAVFGSAVGIAAGGMIAATHGWQAAFIWVGAASLLLVALYPALVREPAREHAPGSSGSRIGLRQAFRLVLSPRSARFLYVGSGMQVLVLAVLAAWLPSFLVREYALPVDQAGLRGGTMILLAGVGMIVGGVFADRGARTSRVRKLQLAAAYTTTTFALLTIAFALPPGRAQLVLLCAGTFAAGCHAGAITAAIIDVTHPAVRATGIATLALFNNLIGLAPGPYLVGLLSDATNLKTAMTVAPVAGLLAAACFLLAARSYDADLIDRDTAAAW
jgi:predicted MFS family arabinose efflux permease